MLPPTHAQMAYGEHPRQRLDLWLADSATPTPLYLFIHGGGFARGDKGRLPSSLLDELLKRGISLAAMNYRFADDPQFAAPMLDGARVLQFIRHHAYAWNIDKNRIAAGGSSAGACISFWLGLGPERAEPDSADPISRESTRLACIAAFQAPTSLNPHFIRKNIGGIAWRSPAVQVITRLKPEQYDTAEARKIFQEFDFITHVTPSSPPVFLYNVTPDLPMSDDLPHNVGIHHPHFSRLFKKEMDRQGTRCTLRLAAEFPGLTGEEIIRRFHHDLAEFVSTCLKA